MRAAPARRGAAASEPPRRAWESAPLDAAQIEKMSAKIGMSKPGTQIVGNNQ
jgi:hypothetical protein